MRERNLNTINKIKNLVANSKPSDGRKIRRWNRHLNFMVQLSENYEAYSVYSSEFWNSINEAISIEKLYLTE